MQFFVPNWRVVLWRLGPISGRSGAPAASDLFSKEVVMDEIGQRLDCTPEDSTLVLLPGKL